MCSLKNTLKCPKKNFLNVQSSTRKDVYIFGCQEINSESVYTWEVQLQKCVGKKYILLHAVRFGTIHLSIFVRHELQGKVNISEINFLDILQRINIPRALEYFTGTNIKCSH